MLEAKGLTKRYASVPAVQNVDFCLLAGQVLGCLGPNGSGKSTTVKMLTGLLDPTAGKVFLHGRDIRDDLVLDFLLGERNAHPGARRAALGVVERDHAAQTTPRASAT